MLNVHCPQRCNNRDGFTLMELVVASLLLGITIMGLTAFGGVAKGAAKTGREAEAALYVQQLADMLRTEVRYDESGYQPGLVPSNGPLRVSVPAGATYSPAASYTAGATNYPDPDGSGDPDGKFDGLPDTETALSRAPCATGPTGCLATASDARRWYVVTDETLTVTSGSATATPTARASQTPDVKKVQVLLRWDE